MFGKIARGVTARPWVVIAGWLAAAGAIIAFSPAIGSVTTSDQASFLPSSTESSRAGQLAAMQFPTATGARAVIVVTRTDAGTLQPADLVTIKQLAGRLNATRPDGLQAVQVDPQISANRRVGLLAAQFAAPAHDSATARAVTALRASTTKHLAGTGLTASMTGEAAIALDNTTALSRAEVIVTIATAILIVVLLLLIFRSPVAALLPLLTVGLVFAMATSLVAIAATVFGFRVGQELPTMLTVVLFGIGTDYIVFLLFRYRERRRAGDEPRAAIITAVQRVGEAIFSAAFAVIAAFGALALAALGFFTTLGPALAIGVAVMLLAALTLVPAVVTVVGRYVFWPSRATRTTRLGGFGAVGRLVSRRPGAVVAAATVLLGGLAAGMWSFTSQYDPLAQLPANTEAEKAFRDLKNGFPAGALQPTHVYVTQDRPMTAAQTSTLVRALSAVTGVAAPLPPLTSADGTTVDVAVMLRDDPYSSQALDLVSGPVRDAARAAAPAGATVLLGGPTMSFADVRHVTDRDLGLILPVAALAFVLILGALLRSVLAPAYLVVMVVVGFAATLGASALVFQGALGHSGLAFTIPIIVYLFVTAIGTDYNILMTSRLREEMRDGRSPREAAALAIAHAGPSVAAAAVILAGTFGALMLSGVPLFTEIGFAVTFGIVVVAFVVALLLVPATTALAGPAAWWPGTGSRLSSARHDRHAVVHHAVAERR